MSSCVICLTCGIDRWRERLGRHEGVQSRRGVLVACLFGDKASIEVIPMAVDVSADRRALLLGALEWRLHIT